MAFVYILASQKNGTLYIGVTSDLRKRIWEHKNNVVQGFTSRYNVHRLVYYAVYEDVLSAIASEKKLKNFGRKQKIALIEKNNLEWNDLYETLA